MTGGSLDGKSGEYVYRKGKLVSSRYPKGKGVRSPLIVNLIASFYDTYLPSYAKGRLIELIVTLNRYHHG
jgi:hypothetical protein